MAIGMEQGAVVVDRARGDERIDHRNDDALAVEAPAHHAGRLEQRLRQGQLPQRRQVRVERVVGVFREGAAQEFQPNQPVRGDQFLTEQ